jgi:ethanolamine ammonia-lyase small subunit
VSDDAPVSVAQRWARLAALTPARIGLGRAGHSLPTREVLRFGFAHAQARDAVHEPFRPDEIAAALAGLGLDVVSVASAANDRAEYLRRPDLGRGLAAESLARLDTRRAPCDLAIVVADGLSAIAVHANAVPLIAALLPRLAGQGRTLGPVAIAAQARVALGDAIGQALGARMALVLIGERPGLSAPDSLGAYLTFAPRPGLSDAARNCVSNIRPGGLASEDAAGRLVWLIEQAFARSLTGVMLKDESSASAGCELPGPEAAVTTPGPRD